MEGFIRFIKFRRVADRFRPICYPLFLIFLEKISKKVLTYYTTRSII
nr:MAG TPA: hypothetical protein [Caudoviricetes sp.]